MKSQSKSKMKIKIKFNRNLLKKDAREYKRNLLNNEPIINQKQLGGFLIYVWYLFIPFFAGRLMESVHWTLGLLILIPLLFRLEIKFEKKNNETKQ